MDTAHPNETQYYAHHNTLTQPDELTTSYEHVLSPHLTTSHSPSTGLMMTGTIAGLANWYEADKLADHGLDWPGDIVKCDLIEMLYLYLTRVYDVPRTEENFHRFFDTVFNEDLEPVINFESEKVAVVANVRQCYALLNAISAEKENYDSARAAQPAFPPM